MTVLAAYDATRESHAALEHAARAASVHGSRLHIVWCIVHEAGESPTRVRQETEHAEEAARELDELVARFAAEGLEATTSLRHSLAVDVAQAILDEADDVDAELVVMGFVPRARITEFVLGSVAREVVKRASCPVMTVKAAED